MIMLIEIFDTLRGTADPSTEYEIGASLFARGDEVKSVFLLEEGAVKLSRSLEDGKELVLHRARGPGIAAEASIYSATYH
jgi:CRP-like cAMP-binding protein